MSSYSTLPTKTMEFVPLGLTRKKKKSLCGDLEGKHDIEPNKEKKKVYFSSFISFGDLNVNYIWYCDNDCFFKCFFV
jgi:hypothetical protein